MGLVAYQGKSAAPDEVSRKAQDDPGGRQVMQEYLPAPGQDLRDGRGPVEAGPLVRAERVEGPGDRQSHAVIRRDPSRKAAWKRLQAYKKVGGRWIKPEWQATQKHEMEQQNRANKHWKPILERMRERVVQPGQGASSRRGRGQGGGDRPACGAR